MIDRICPPWTRRDRGVSPSPRHVQPDRMLGLGAILLLVVGLAVPASSLQGASPVAVSAPDPAAVPLGTSMAVPGTSLSGFPTQAVVQVVLSVSSGVLWLPGPATGITVSVGYPALGIPSPTVAYEGMEDDLEVALADLRWTPAEVGPATITVAASLGGASFDPGSGHHYQVVAASGITWDDARVAAEGTSFNGLTGYLATLTSADEAAFVVRTTMGTSWIGASDRGVEGRWKWVTGPEAGTTFWVPMCSSGLVGDCLGFGFSSWGSGEPDDAGAGQDVAVLDSPEEAGLWIDRSGDTTSSPSAYLVEFGGTVGSGGTVETPTYEGHASTVVTSVTVPGAPGSVTADAADESATATVSWTAPVSNGWSVVTGYSVTGTPEGACTSEAPETSCTVEGLTAGTSYVFQVTATNSVGEGPASAPAFVVTPPLPLPEPATTTPDPPQDAEWEPTDPADPTSADTSSDPAEELTDLAETPSGGADQAETAPAEPGLHVVFDVGVGVDAAGARLTVRGTGLDPAVAATITVHSTPVVLDTVTPDAEGTLSQDVFLPADLEDGEHVIVGHGKATAGHDVYRVPSFAVEGGKISRIGLRRSARLAPAAENAASSAAEPADAVGDPTPSGGSSKMSTALLVLVLAVVAGGGFVVLRRRRASSAAPRSPKHAARPSPAGAPPAGAHARESVKIG